MDNIWEIGEKIKKETNLIDIIKHYENIEKTGSSTYKAKCPIHTHVDNNPSLSISEEKQLYNCFVCKKGGDVFTFVQEFERISREDAIVKVSEIIGKPIHRNNYSKANNVYEKNKDIYDILNDTITFTQYILKQNIEFDGLKYLKDRGLTQEIIDYFQIGQVNHDNMIQKFLLAKNYSEKTMLDARLVNINEYGSYDVFKDRILFPIHDEFDNPVGFTARTINNDDRKYINSSESKVYKKSNVLYNLNRVLKRNSKPETIYLTEGVMDAISLHMAGIKNVIASLGTSFTDNQVALLKKLKCKVIIAYDGDNAGYNATHKASQLLIKANISFQIIYNTTNKDFDDIIKQEGINEVINMCNNPLTYGQFIIEYYKNIYNLDNHSDKKEFINVIQNELINIKDEFEIKEIQIAIKNLTGHDLKLNNLNHINSNINTNKVIRPKVIPIKGINKIEQSIIFLMINNENAIVRFKEKLGYLTDDNLNKLAMRIIEYYRINNKFDIKEFLNNLNDPNERNLLVSIYKNELYNPNYKEELFDQLVNKLYEDKLLEQEQELISKVSKVNDKEKQSDILKQLSEIRKERRKIFNGEKRN